MPGFDDLDEGIHSWLKARMERPKPPTVPTPPTPPTLPLPTPPTPPVPSTLDADQLAEGEPPLKKCSRCHRERQWQGETHRCLPCRQSDTIRQDKIRQELLELRATWVPGAPRICGRCYVKGVWDGFFRHCLACRQKQLARKRPYA